MLPEPQLPLANVALILGIGLTIILIINGLLEMPVKIRAFLQMWRR